MGGSQQLQFWKHLPKFGRNTRKLYLVILVYYYNNLDGRYDKPNIVCSRFDIIHLMAVRF